MMLLWCAVRDYYGLFVIAVLKRSPRRLQAALALRRRASFYSSLSGEYSQAGGAGSRHWARAESQVSPRFIPAILFHEY